MCALPLRDLAFGSFFCQGKEFSFVIPLTKMIDSVFDVIGCWYSITAPLTSWTVLLLATTLVLTISDTCERCAVREL